MQKIQVFLREDQKAALETLATRTGIRQSDLVRQGVDLLLEDSARRDSDWREATRAIAGVWSNRRDVEKIVRHIRTSAKRRFAGRYRRD